MLPLPLTLRAIQGATPYVRVHIKSLIPWEYLGHHVTLTSHGIKPFITLRRECLSVFGSRTHILISSQKIYHRPIVKCTLSSFNSFWESKCYTPLLPFACGYLVMFRELCELAHDPHTWWDSLPCDIAIQHLLAGLYHFAIPYQSSVEC